MDRKPGPAFSAYPRSLGASDVLPHHAGGRGEVVGAICPATREATVVTKLPLITESLLGTFTKGKRKYHALSASVFTESVLDHVDVSIWPQTLPKADELLWVPAFSYTRALQDPDAYGIFLSVFARVNFSRTILRYEQQLMHKKREILVAKTKIFQDSHFSVTKYLDSMLDPRDDLIDKQELALIYAQSRPGVSRFDDDRPLCQIERIKTKHRLTPLEHIEINYPQFRWRLETVDINPGLFNKVTLGMFPGASSHPESHQIFYRCLTLQGQCEHWYAETGDDELYFYYCAFVDLFYYCKNHKECRIDDAFLTGYIDLKRVTVLEFFYPYGERTFTWRDLPDIYHTLIRIPLHGQQRTPQTQIGLFLQKCLPFSCQRRTLFKQFITTLKKREGIAYVICQLFWCLLANLHTGVKKTFNMPRLLRAKYLTSSPNILCASFERLFAQGGDPVEFRSENNKGCFVVILAFHSYIYAMTRNNPQYGELAEKHIDWKTFEAQTVEGLKQMQNVDIFVEDSFREARNTLPNLPIRRTLTISRYKKENLENYLFKFLRRAYEKITKKKLQTSEIPYETRRSILNFLIRVPVADRLSPMAVSVLRLAPYGGISDDSVGVVQMMIELYKTQRTMPRAVSSLTNRFQHASDIEILGYYIQVVININSIKVLPLDAWMIKNIDVAMQTKKYNNVPLRRQMFDVFITICCKKIATLCGKHAYGHKKLTFDVKKGVFFCARAAKSKEEQKKQKKKKTDQSALIRCDGAQALRINLRGLKLVYNNDVYMHCPRCASFHIYDWKNFAGSIDGRYRCGECVLAETESLESYRCFQCEAKLTPVAARQRVLTFDDTEKMTSTLYFCKKHYGIAKHLAGRTFVHKLKTKINKREAKNALKRIY